MRKGLMKAVAGVMTIALLSIGGGTTVLAADAQCEHVYSQGIIKNGIVSEYVCELCGESGGPVDYVKSPDECTHKDEDGNPTIDEINYKSKTCTEDGHTVDTYCYECGKVLKYGEVVKASHDWEEQEDEEIEPGCFTPGARIFRCNDCGAEKKEAIPARGKHRIGEYSEFKTVKEATCGQDGKQIVYCPDCGAGVSRVIKATGRHSWSMQKVTPKSSTKATITYICKKCKKTKAVTVNIPKKGKKVTVEGNVYKVTKAASEVAFTKAKKKATSLVIPATVKIQGITYKVTSVDTKAVSNNKVLKTVRIGTNVMKIAKKAFVKCPALKTIKIDSKKLTKKTASKASFKGINKKAVIKADKKVKASYKKIFAGMKVR